MRLLRWLVLFKVPSVPLPYAATEKLAYGRDPTCEDTLNVSLQSGIQAGCMKEIACRLCQRQMMLAAPAAVCSKSRASAAMRFSLAFRKCNIILTDNIAQNRQTLRSVGGFLVRIPL